MQPRKSEESQIPLIENSVSKYYHTYSNELCQDEKEPPVPAKPPPPPPPYVISKRDIFENVGSKLAYRKSRFYKRRLIADLSLVFACLGIVIMITDTEIAISGKYGRDYGASSIISMMVKLSVTLTTVILLGFLVWYHRICVQIFMLDNSIDDWRLAMSASTVVGLALELLVCSVHPVPVDYFQVNNATTTVPGSAFVDMKGPLKGTTLHILRSPINVVFGLVMFLRVYIACRVVMLHSRIYQDASAQSLGALNRIHFNFRFIFKSLMNVYPEYVLTLLILVLFVWASWALRACEIYHHELRDNFFNCMWVVAITFLSVGYGEIVPESYCGRSIAVLTGIFGAGCTALVVAVLARKLELSRAEKYVHNFVMDIELDKQMKHAAINVIKEGWLVFKNKRAGTRNMALEHQRRLLQSIRKIRDLKNERRRLADNAVNLLEVHHSQSSLHQAVASLNQKVGDIDEAIKGIDSKLKLLIDRK